MTSIASLTHMRDIIKNNEHTHILHRAIHEPVQERRLLLKGEVVVLRNLKVGSLNGSNAIGTGSSLPCFHE